MPRFDSLITSASPTATDADVAAAEAAAIAAAAIQSAADAAAAEAAAILSSNTFTRTFSGPLRATLLADQVIPAGSPGTPIVFDDVEIDINGDYNPATGIYTPPAINVQNTYRVRCRLLAAAGIDFVGQILVGGVAASETASSVANIGAGLSVVELDALALLGPGDTIAVQVIDVGGAGFNVLAPTTPNNGSWLEITVESAT